MDGDQKQQLDELKTSLQRHEEGMMEVFIKEGPDALRSLLGVKSGGDWKLIFDHLVNGKNVLEKCAIDYMPFFTDLVVKNGPAALRTIFKLDGVEYDRAFKRLMETVAVSHGAIYQYVLNNGDFIAGRILSGESRTLRSDLCIAERKYDGLWAEILDLLQNAVCRTVYDEKICEDGLMALTMFLNTLRVQRPLVNFGQ